MHQKAGCEGGWRMLTFRQATTQWNGAREQDRQRAEREEREAQRTGEVHLKGWSPSVSECSVIAIVVRT